MADILGLTRSIDYAPTDISAASDDLPAAKSKRERRVDSIGVSVQDLDLNFRRVFKNEWKKNKDGDYVFSHGHRVPVSNLTKLYVKGMDSELMDDKTCFVITGVVYNNYTHTTHYPEIALYRTTVKELWHPNMKGKIYCDCEAFRYFLAYPNHQPNKNVRDVNRDAALRYAAKTHHDPGPSRIRNAEETPAMCKHLAKLWRHITANGGLGRFSDG